MFKKLFSDNTKLARLTFTALLLSMFGAVFGQAVYAQFTRINGNTGWGYGYGYGYGYGEGWDGGGVAGYETTFLTQPPFLYGFGYGYGFLSYEFSSSAYNPSTDTFEIDPNEIPNLLIAGILVPGGNDPTNTDSATINQNVRIVNPGMDIMIPKNTVMFAGENTSFTTLFATSGIDTSDLPEGESVGDMAFGLPNLGLSLSQSVTISIFVGSDYNGLNLTVYSKEPGGEWVILTSCGRHGVSEGYCTFSTDSLSDFAVVASGPVVSNNGVSAGNSTGATLNGTITSLGSGEQPASSRGFRYGVSTSYGATSTESGEFGTGSFFQAIAGLTCATLYHFQAFAINSGGVGYSTDSTFTTGSCTGGGGGGGGGGSGGGSIPYTTTFQTSTSTGGTTREDYGPNLANLFRIGVAVHDLVKLQCPANNAVNDPCTAVYYAGADGKRHAFPNDKLYFTWYADFSGVRIISGVNLASIPLGKNVTYKPGVKMVKFLSNPNVYTVSKGGILRWVTSQAIASALYGSNWNTKIDDISDAFYMGYRFGADIYSASDYSPSAAVASVTYPSDSLDL